MRANENTFKDYCLEQLEGLGRVTAKSMFGGHGLYFGAVFFGIVFRGKLYFRTDEDTRPAYIERGMQPFKPSETQTLKTYYEVPGEVLEKASDAVRWAGRAVVSRPARSRVRGRKRS